jgi:hypothetical protein
MKKGLLLFVEIDAAVIIYISFLQELIPFSSLCAIVIILGYT